MRRFLLTAALTIPLLVGAAAAPATQALPLPQATTCSGVWVVVDFGSLGGTSTRCATSHSTGTAALKSAGFSPSLGDGMVLRISGKPGSPDINKAYWSYWHATRSADGSYSDWGYSTLGANAYQPKQGNAEGWRYQSLNDGEVPPAVAPPVASAEPSPTPTPKKSSSKPKPTATATRSQTAKASPTPTATTSARSTSSPTPSAATTRSPTPTPEVAGATATPSPAGESTTLAQDEASAPEPTSGGGSPVGVIVAGSAVLLAGAGLGGWWLWRGRKR